MGGVLGSWVGSFLALFNEIKFALVAAITAITKQGCFVGAAMVTNPF